MIKKSKKFVEDVQAEFKKVQYPTRQATIKSTSIVIVVTAIIAIYLGISDFGLSELMQILLAR